MLVPDYMMAPGSGGSGGGSGGVPGPDPLLPPGGHLVSNGHTVGCTERGRGAGDKRVCACHKGEGNARILQTCKHAHTHAHTLSHTLTLHLYEPRTRTHTLHP